MPCDSSYMAATNLEVKISQVARLRQCPTHGQQPANAWACPECLRELREELARFKVPAADGEREELAADLDECADSCVLAEKHNWAKHMRRAAALLRQPAPAPVPGWQPMDTAPQDGTEILASDYDAIEIVSWNCEPSPWDSETGEGPAWCDREGLRMYPAWWQPLLDHPPIPQPPQGGEVGQ